MSNNLFQRLKKITTFVFDVDGVMTDGTMLLLENGDFARRMNYKDGYALIHAGKMGFNVVVISGKGSKGVEIRLKGLNIEDVYLFYDNKKEVLQKVIDEKSLSKEDILYMGDDLPDYEAMQMAGFKACPNDAAPDILEIADYVSPKKGGEGCVRDIIEKVMRIQKKWPTQK